MRIALPNAEEVNDSNVVQAVQQVIRALEKNSDMGGVHDSKAEEEIRLLRQEMRAGFERLGDETKVLRKETNERLDKVEGRLENLEHSQNQMVDLLRMIAENTKPRA